MPDTEQTLGDSPFTYEVSADESMSEGVIRAVSMFSGSDPVPGPSASRGSGHVLEPLHVAIDPDALDSLFERTGSRPVQPQSMVTFAYHDYEVTVTGEGCIAVESLESSTPESAD